MIICFSGTGNTRSVADHLSSPLGDEVFMLSTDLMREPEKIMLKVPDGRLIWAFPIHGWGLPLIVGRVIKDMRILGQADVVHHFVCSCGDDIGYADKVWRTELAARGWRTGSAFSVQMPNNYVAFPGFDVDSREVMQEKLDKMPERVKAIAMALERGENAVDVVRGLFPRIKTYVIGWYFRHFLTGTKPFRADDSCVGCGKCARNCPLGCIDIVNGKPRWEDKCTMCLRCYHLCPCHALRYGGSTKGKGQYLHPGYKPK